MVTGNAHESLGLTALLGKRDGFASSTGTASPSPRCTPRLPVLLTNWGTFPYKHSQSTTILQSVVILQAMGITAILLFL